MERKVRTWITIIGVGGILTLISFVATPPVSSQNIPLLPLQETGCSWSHCTLYRIWSFGWINHFNTYLDSLMSVFTHASAKNSCVAADTPFSLRADSEGEIIGYGFMFYDTPPIVFKPQGRVEADIRGLSLYYNGNLISEDITTRGVPEKVAGRWKEQWQSYIKGSGSQSKTENGVALRVSSAAVTSQVPLEVSYSNVFCPFPRYCGKIYVFPHLYPVPSLIPGGYTTQSFPYIALTGSRNGSVTFRNLQPGVSDFYYYRNRVAANGGVYSDVEYTATSPSVTIVSDVQDERYQYAQPTSLLTCNSNNDFTATCIADKQLIGQRVRVDVNRSIVEWDFTSSDTHWDYLGLGTMIDSVFVDVKESCDVLPTVSLFANGKRHSAIVNYGDNVNLTWKSKNAVSCTASGGWSGAKVPNSTVPETVYNLTKTTDFSIACKNAANQTARDTVTVTVRPPPTPSPTLSPSPTLTVSPSPSPLASPTELPGGSPTPSPIPECSDGRDNDGDGKIDCTPGNSDPGCYTDRSNPATCNPNDTSESDVPPIRPGGVGETD